MFNNPTVNGEPVTVLRVLGEKDRPVEGKLGASVRGANVLVQYPDGEEGYVRMEKIHEGAK